MILKHIEGDILVGEMQFTGKKPGGNIYEFVVTRAGTAITSALGWETKANGTIEWKSSNKKCSVICRESGNYPNTEYTVQTSLVCNNAQVGHSGVSHASPYDANVSRGACLYWLRNMPPAFQDKYPNGAIMLSNSFYYDPVEVTKYFDVNSGNTPGTVCYVYGGNFSDSFSIIDVRKVISAYGADIDPDPQPEPPKFPGDDNEKDPPGGDGEGPEGIEDDPIEFPEKPEITVTDAGLMTLYTPTQGQIHAFGDFLWSDAFSLDTFKKLFADPMQAVIGLSIVPVSVPTAGAQPITIGAISSGVTANRAASQYVVHDCGTLKVNPVWNTALDFSPYTKFSIYLPFIGTRELKTDDIMGKELNVKYFVDVLSGACTAHISVGGSVLYQFSGSCATPVPLSAMNWNSTLTSMIQLAGAGIAMAVTGGAAAPAAAGMLTTATGMIGNKPNVQRSGAVSGAAGMLGVKTPYLIRETPRQSLAKDYAHYSGYPSNITAVLGTLKGFTMVENMHLKNIDATADELDEIETALKEGVIL